MKADCGHEAGEKAIRVSGEWSLCPRCLTRRDVAYVADPMVFTFVARIHEEGLIVTNQVGAKLGDITTMVDGVFCSVRTSDGRQWRARGAMTGDWTHFQLTEE